MASKGMKLEIMPDEIMHFGISVSKNGYKSAGMLVKKGDKEYMSVNYEWEGDSIPDFVMTLMGFIKANKETVEANFEAASEEEKEYAKNKCGAGKKKGK